jgi:hypothetical protein
LGNEGKIDFETNLDYTARPYLKKTTNQPQANKRHVFGYMNFYSGTS